MSETKEKPNAGGPLYAQLRWFIRLRWLAAAGVIAGSVLDRHLGWFHVPDRFLLIGLIIAAYNVALWTVVRRVRSKKTRLLTALAESQLLLDMICLTALSMWTGGVRSPLVGFFVFHMVFASLLLREVTAFAAAAGACILLACGLALSHKWPENVTDRLAGVGVLVTLIFTVLLTNRITHDLRAQRRRLIRANRRARAMSEQLRRHQQAMIQHEKMVAMGQMAAGVTHEITNPLASIDSLLQLAERRPDRLANGDTVHTLRDQVARINQIIQQMKTFAHPEDAQFQTLPLNEVVEQGIGMVRFDRRLKHVEVARSFDPNAGAVAMLPQALEQVLVNLIINALDAMQDVGKAILSIRTHRHQGWVTIEIADTGHGIDPRHMPRLFEPFFTTKPVGKGTGLGLSISYSLMQKMGGSMSVRSEPGKGTMFTLRLPVAHPPSRKRETISAGIAANENPSA